MIYAVNRRTKEHRVATPGHPYSMEWRFDEADDDGWIPWEGGECPLPEGALHEVKSANGAVLKSDEPENDYWGMRHGSARIIAYRPILDADPSIDVTRPDAEPPCAGCEGTGVTAFGDACPVCTKPEAPAWDGEGLPPVGCECECYVPSRGCWTKVKIVAHDGDVAIFKNGAGHLYAGALADLFRPLHSEEDRAVDAMLSIVEHSEGHYTLCGPMADAMRKLYRAGLRFPEKEAT